jgi:putative flippase GtrA
MRIRGDFIKFGIVGGVCFVASFVTLYASVSFLSLHYLIGTVLSIVVGNCVGWLLNRFWTFRSKDDRICRQIAKYLAVNLGSNVSAFFLMYALVSRCGMNYLLASIVVAITMFLINYSLHKYWSFSTNK